MSTTGIVNGSDPQTDIPEITNRLVYNQDAPVLALDGLSTRLYSLYSGSQIVFNTEPVPAQESYYVSQVFPIDNHPLDSLTSAENGCVSYPNGIFTQSLNSFLTCIDQPVTVTGALVISTVDLPVQEAPAGVINGINTVFTLSLSSCGGQNSLMLWIDGIFQPPTTYSYATIGSTGQITLSAPPVPGQTLWAWYLPLGDGCSDERVVQLTATANPQIFNIPDSPMLESTGVALFLDGLYQLQGTDYEVPAGNTTVQYLGSLQPAPSQTLWCHFNIGSVSDQPWRQIQIGVGDGSTTSFNIPYLLTSQLPTSQDSVLLALDGLMQRCNVDFTVGVDFQGFPTNVITFTHPPEAERNIQVAYITRD